MNHDSLNSMTAPAALEAAFVVLDGLQGEAKHKQVIGITLLFSLMCERLNLDISEMLDKAQRMTHDANTNYHAHLHALRMYIDNELKGTN